MESSQEQFRDFHYFWKIQLQHWFGRGHGTDLFYEKLELVKQAWHEDMTAVGGVQPEGIFWYLNYFSSVRKWTKVCVLWWTEVPSRVHFHLAPGVPRTDSWFTASPTRIRTVTRDYTPSHTCLSPRFQSFLLKKKKKKHVVKVWDLRQQCPIPYTTTVKTTLSFVGTF